MSEALSSTIVVGIDTHKFVHAAVAITELGTRLGQVTIPVSAKGYHDLEAWARCFGPVKAFGMARVGMNPALNAISTLLIVATAVLMAVADLFRRRAAIR